MVAVTDLPDLQGLADSASAHVNGQLLLLAQNPGVKKWFGIPVPFSSRYAILHMRSPTLLLQRYTCMLTKQVTKRV